MYQTNALYTSFWSLIYMHRKLKRFKKILPNWLDVQNIPGAFIRVLSWNVLSWNAHAWPQSQRAVSAWSFYCELVSESLISRPSVPKMTRRKQMDETNLMWVSHRKHDSKPFEFPLVHEPSWEAIQGERGTSHYLFMTGRYRGRVYWLILDLRGGYMKG